MSCGYGLRSYFGPKRSHQALQMPGNEPIDVPSIRFHQYSHTYRWRSTTALLLGERCLWTNTLVSEDVEEPTLGIDWLKKYDCVWDFTTGLLCIDGQQTITLTRRGHIKSRQVLVKEYQEIHPWSQKEIIATFDTRNRRRYYG